ncbi:uncharacterized protein LOC135834060 [Planococcus citri]|uniref:uncharacterized protein LOC135834060 n=1 Tax=Planococcus citri TaxID=170843 RepID=UPI0031F7C8DD
MFSNFSQSGTIKEVFYSCIILSTSLLVGINRSYLAFLFYQLDLPDSSIIVDDEQKSWIAAFINLLSPLGCIIAGILMDAYGRKISVQGIFVPFLVSWLMIAFAKNVPMLYMAALIQSISIGMSFSTATYVSEISTADHRGALLGIIEILLNFGVLLCNVLMYYMKWSLVSLIFTGLSAVFLLLSFTLPESPIWLYLKGRQEQSINTLTALRGGNRDTVDSEIEDMDTYISSKVKMNPKEIIRNCLRSWRQFSIACVLYVLQQNTGYSVMTLFIIMIVDRLHIPYRSTDVALLYSFAGAIGGFITPYVMYRFNRKPTLAISAIGMVIFAAIVPIYGHIFEPSEHQIFAWIIPVALCMYVISASFGVIPVGFTIAGELFPNEVRGIMGGLYGAFAYIHCSLLYKISPWYLTTFGASGVMWTFSGFALLTAMFSVFILPETKGKTLNEVQEEYFKKKTFLTRICHPMKSTGFYKQLCYSSITLLTYVLVGINWGYLSFLFHQLDSPGSKITINDDQKSWLSGSLSLLSPLGCLVSGIIMDYYGRKILVLLTFTPFIISWLVIGFSKNYVMLLTGILIQGIGGGMTVCLLTYISEISTSNYRGSLLSIVEVSENAGVLICNLLMYYLPWNTVGFIFSASSLVAFIISFTLPESPIWLYSHGKQEKAVKTLCSIRCQKPDEIESEIQEMEAACIEQTQSNFQQLIKNCFKAWKPFTLCIALFVLKQQTGYSVMVAYTVTVVDNMKIPFDSSTVAVIYSIVGLLGSLATLFLMHRFGRKTILSGSALGMGLSTIAIALYQEIYRNNEGQKSYSWIIPGALYCYVFLCNVGVLPINYVMCGELFPHEVRGTMNGLYGIVAYIYWALTLKFYPMVMFTFGIKVTIWTFTVFCFLVALFGIFVLPETKGKTLNEVQETYFNKKTVH